VLNLKRFHHIATSANEPNVPGTQLHPITDHIKSQTAREARITYSKCKESDNFRASPAYGHMLAPPLVWSHRQRARTHLYCILGKLAKWPNTKHNEEDENQARRRSQNFPRLSKGRSKQHSGSNQASGAD
jgi:hypothetical protein